MMMKKLILSFRVALILLLLLLFIAVGWASFNLGMSLAYERQIFPVVEILSRASKNTAVLATLLFFLVIVLFMWSSSFSMKLLEERQKWLIDVLNVKLKGMNDDVFGIEKAIEDEQSASHTDSTGGKAHWPWGQHHSKSLGDLEAAARRFWILYDVSEPSTAPTNNMVADWLITERGVSKDKANAIASILRADGLPAGPRR